MFRKYRRLHNVYFWYRLCTCRWYRYLYPTPVHTLLERGVSGITSISSLDWTLAANLLAKLGLPATERWHYNLNFILGECPETKELFLFSFLYLFWFKLLWHQQKKVYTSINFLPSCQWNSTLQTYLELNQSKRIIHE